MSLSCAIVQDLLPIYVENAASEETDRQIAEHLKQCEPCRLKHLACQIQLRKQQTNRKRVTPNMLVEDSLMKQIKGQSFNFQVSAVMMGTLIGLFAAFTAGTWLMSLVYGVIGATGQMLSKRPWPAPLFALAMTLIYSGFVSPEVMPVMIAQILVNPALAFVGGLIAHFMVQRNKEQTE